MAPVSTSKSSSKSSQKVRRSPSKTAVKSSYKSSEYVQDSDDEPAPTTKETSKRRGRHDAHAVTGKAKTPLARNAKHGSSSESESGAASSSSDDTSVSEDEDMHETNGPVSGNDASSSSDSDADSADKQTRPRNGNHGGKNHPQHTDTPQTASTGGDVAITARIASTWKPPHGFQAATISSDPRPAASRLASAAALDGEEIWYITAPASMSIADLGLTSFAKTRKRRAAYVHEETGLAITEDDGRDSSEVNLLVPRPSKGGYVKSPHTINRTIHIRQAPYPSPSSTASHLASSSTPATSTTATTTSSRVVTARPMPVRKQPDGLRIRYAPLGFEEHRRAGASGATDEARASASRAGGEVGAVAVEEAGSSPRKRSKSGEEGKRDAAQDEVKRMEKEATRRRRRKEKEREKEKRKA